MSRGAAANRRTATRWGDRTRESADGKRQVELTIERDRHELTVKADLRRRRRALSAFEVEYLGGNRKELERLSTELDVLRARAADPSLFYLGDDELGLA